MTEKRLSEPYSDYAVDSAGNVWSYKGAEGKKSKVATRKDSNGYLRVNLSNNEEANGFKDFRVHELVARAFLGARPEGAQILHKDGNMTNNSASNLSYGSASENAVQREADKRQDSLLRIDSSIELGEWKVTPEGYLEATAVLARVGPMTYLDESGQPYIEFVTEEALKNDVDTLNGKPLTYEHPPEGEVTAENFREYVVGIVQEARYDDGLQAQVGRVIVHDFDTIKRVVQDNIREVSPGYRADVIHLRDTNDPYPIRQMRRVNNHVAITRAGRGGPESAIRLDSQGHITIATREDAMTQEEIENMKAKMDALEAERADMASKLDAANAELEAMKKMADKDKGKPKMDSAEFTALFNERKEAIELAELRNVQVNDSWTNEELKAAIVKEALGEVRTDSVEAVNGMYQAVKRMTPTKNSPDHLAFQTQHNDSAEPADDDLFAFYEERRGDSLFNFKTQE